MSRLTGDQVRQLRKQARCPDCASTVTVDRSTRRVDVHHDETCPTLARLQRHGGTVSLAFTKPADQTDQEFAAATRRAAARIAKVTGAPVRLRTSPYGGLPPL